jgi:hypothetical protein
MAISVWQERADRARAALANLREHTKSAIVHARRDGETIAAGALAGAVRGSFQASGKEYAIPGPNGTKIPPELVAGGLALGVAFSGQTEVSDDLHAIGAGILAYSAGREAEQWMMRKGVKPPGTVQ